MQLMHFAGGLQFLVVALFRFWSAELRYRMKCVKYVLSYIFMIIFQMWKAVCGPTVGPQPTSETKLDTFISCYSHQPVKLNWTITCIVTVVGCFWFNGPMRQYFSLYRTGFQQDVYINTRITRVSQTHKIGS